MGEQKDVELNKAASYREVSTMAVVRNFKAFGPRAKPKSNFHKQPIVRSQSYQLRVFQNQIDSLSKEELE